MIKKEREKKKIAQTKSGSVPPIVIDKADVRTPKKVHMTCYLMFQQNLNSHYKNNGIQRSVPEISK